MPKAKQVRPAPNSPTPAWWSPKTAAALPPRPAPKNNAARKRQTRRVRMHARNWRRSLAAPLLLNLLLALVCALQRPLLRERTHG